MVWLCSVVGVCVMCSSGLGKCSSRKLGIVSSSVSYSVWCIFLLIFV